MTASVLVDSDILIDASRGLDHNSGQDLVLGLVMAMRESGRTQEISYRSNRKLTRSVSATAPNRASLRPGRKRRAGSLRGCRTGDAAPGMPHREIVVCEMLSW
jgi:hypothetical protein